MRSLVQFCENFPKWFSCAFSCLRSFVLIYNLSVIMYGAKQIAGSSWIEWNNSSTIDVILTNNKYNFLFWFHAHTHTAVWQREWGIGSIDIGLFKRNGITMGIYILNATMNIITCQYLSINPKRLRKWSKNAIQITKLTAAFAPTVIVQHDNRSLAHSAISLILGCI